MDKIKISYLWLSKKIDCSKEGIARCEGKCCKGFSFYPSKSNLKDGKPIGKCFFLSTDGCILKREQKPIKCLLYPLVFNKKTLCLHGRALCSLCNKNYNQGNKTILESNVLDLIEVFGEENVERIKKSVLIDKKDCFIFLSPELKKQLEKEELFEKLNKIPEPRR